MSGLGQLAAHPLQAGDEQGVLERGAGQPGDGGAELEIAGGEAVAVAPVCHVQHAEHGVARGAALQRQREQ